MVPKVVKFPKLTIVGIESWTLAQLRARVRELNGYTADKGYVEVSDMPPMLRAYHEQLYREVARRGWQRSLF